MTNQGVEPPREDEPKGAAALPSAEPSDELPVGGRGAVTLPPRRRWCSGRRMYPCSRCDYSTSEREGLSKHYRRSHQGRVYKCSIWGGQTTSYERTRSHRWWNPRCCYAVDVGSAFGPPMASDPQAATLRHGFRGSRGYPSNRRPNAWVMSGPTEVEVVPAGAALPLDPGPSDEEDDIDHQREPAP